VIRILMSTSRSEDAKQMQQDLPVHWEAGHEFAHRARSESAPTIVRPLRVLLKPKIEEEEALAAGGNQGTRNVAPIHLQLIGNLIAKYRRP